MGACLIILKPYLLQTLKELAMLGGVENKIEISSFELAKQLDTSQQTASRYLVELDKKALIDREMGIKKQIISINDKGVAVLEKEYLDYQRVFEISDKIYFTGELVSGFGEGRYYTSQKGYMQQFKEKLGFKPYPGTFNVEIKQVEKNKLRMLKKHEGIHISSFKNDNRTFGDVVCYHASVDGLRGAVVLPIRSHYSSVVEIISKFFLREELDVDDGDCVEIVVDLK